MNHLSQPLRKKCMTSILYVFFNYASFILRILEVHCKYALSELPKKSINEV